MNKTNIRSLKEKQIAQSLNSYKLSEGRNVKMKKKMKYLM